jgi:hypothetical protein
MTMSIAADLTYPVRMGRPGALRRLAEVEWHVVEGASLIARQQRIVANLERTGRDASAARGILQTLEGRQALEEEHLQVLRANLGEGAPQSVPTH